MQNIVVKSVKIVTTVHSVQNVKNVIVKHQNEQELKTTQRQKI
jgi:hypothetical protein